MFEYFPKNYVWNLSVDIALESAPQPLAEEEVAKVETVGVRLLRCSCPSPTFAATPVASMTTAGSRP